MQGRVVCLTSDVARKLINGEESVSLDLGISEDKVAFEDQKVRFPSGDFVELPKLKKVFRRDNVVFILVDSQPVPVEVRNHHYLKLVPTGTAPALEIDGVRMHRTKDISPKEDAERKVGTLNVLGGNLLEIGTGLGYTAEAAVGRGVSCVVSLELNPDVLLIARLNPWSRGLFEQRVINIIIADSCRVVSSLPKEFFDYALHDPPTLARAGELYSEAFYSQLFSALRIGGRLFHYTGLPGATSRRLNIRAGVANRLRRAGFSRVRIDDESEGVYCEKLSRSP